MWARCVGEKSKRGCVSSQHHLFDANAWLDHAREHGPKNQGGDCRRSCPTVSSNAHIDDSASPELTRRRSLTPPFEFPLTAERLVSTIKRRAAPKCVLPGQSSARRRQAGCRTAAAFRQD